MKKIVSLITCITVLWTIPGWAQVDEQSDKTLSYVSTFKPNQFITQWLICGPFPNPDNAGRNIDYLTTAGGEAQIRPKAGMAHPNTAVPDGVVKWQEASAYAYGLLDFMQLPLPHERVVAYAFCYIKAPQAMDVILKLGSDDGVKVWLNGNLVHDKEVGRSARPDEDRIPARMKAGENALLIKVDQSIGGWGLYFRVSHAFPLENGVFLADAKFGPVLAGVEGLASATLSIFNTKDTPVVIDKIEWEENKWLETSSASIGELAPRSWQTFRFQIKNKPIPAPAPSEPIEVYVSAYRSDAQINRISITAHITNVLLQVDGTERGRAVRGFKANLDGVVRPYLIYLPKNYTNLEKVPNLFKVGLPLLIALNPAYSDELSDLDVYFYYGLAQYAEAADFAVVCINGRPEIGWDRLSIYDALDALAIVQSRFPIDADRIYLFGAGRGGDVAYNLGLQYPDLFAAMAVAEGVGPTDLAKNALNLPLYVVNGVWPGANYNELQAFRKMVRLFSSYGCTLKHKEYPDIKWTDFLSKEWEPIFNWFRQYRRVVNPKKVSYSTGQLVSDSASRTYGAYWVRIKPGKDAHAIPQIDATISGNSIDVATVNVKQYALLLNSQLLVLNAPITVRTNGKMSFSGQISKKAIKDNEATLIINLEPKRMTWVFAVIVGFVALAGLSVGCLRLIKIKSQTHPCPSKEGEAEPDIPTLTAGFRGIWLIAMKELRSQLLAEKFMLSTLLCLGMVLMSFWLMTHDYQERLTNYSLSLKKSKNLYSGNLYWYDLEPNHGTGKGAYIRPTPIVKVPNVMSIFVAGLERRMSRPAYYSLHQEVEFDDIPHTNFLIDMYANPDLMYIVQIAMSLLALLFVFQSICGEREKGTLRLMLANAVPRDTILLGKWVGGYIGLVIPFLLAMGVGVLAINLMPSVSLGTEHWIRLAWLLGASLLYISAFFTLGILISTLTKQTITSFLVSLFAWVILVLVLPNTGTLLARELKPVESMQQLQIKKDLMKRQMEDEYFKVQHSGWYWFQTYGLMNFEIWHNLRDTAWKLDADHRRRTQQLADYTRVLTRLSPAAAYAYATMDIAGTNINDELAYYDQLRRYIRNQPQEALQFVSNMLFTHQTWNFHYTLAQWQEGLNHALIDLLLLVLFNAIFFLCAYLAFIRYQVT
jgi:ABC-type transport system involved in multi-copper enzyme maturation permease subunit/pimeloyl-ACP methyl ester carboxylesterase